MKAQDYKVNIMRKLITILVLFIGVFGYSQGGPRVDVIKFRGEVTTTVRNTFDVPTGETWLIWNVTDGRLQIAGSTDVWTDVNGSTGNIYPSATGTYVIGSEDLAFIDIWSTYHTIAPASTAYYNWILQGDLTGAGTLSFRTETTADSDTYATRYTLHPSGTPTDATDLADKAYVDGLASTDDQTATEVPFTPYSTIASTNVQAAIQEVLDEAGVGTVDTFGTPVANDIARFTDANTVEGRSYAELKADLDLEIGTDVQAYSATMDTDNTDDITAVGTPVDNQVLIATGANTAEGDTNLTWDGQIMRMKNYLYLVGAPTSEESRLRFYQNDGTTLAGGITYTAGGAALTISNSLGAANFSLLNSGTASLDTDFAVTGGVTVTDNAYAAGWDGSTNVPTRNAIYDKIEALTAADIDVTGTPTNYSITLANVQDHLEGIDTELGVLASVVSLPAADGTSIVEGSADGTKELRFEVDGLTTATTRVITMKDEDIDLNNMVESITTGLTGADQVLNIVAGTESEINGWGADATRLDICTDCKTPEVIQIACSDLTTSVTTGTSKAYFRMPWAATLTDVRVSLLTAGTATGITVDINESGTTVLSTKLTTDATEATSETATTAAVISDSALADDAVITIDFDAVPTAGAGVIVTLYVEY